MFLTCSEGSPSLEVEADRDDGREVDEAQAEAAHDAVGDHHHPHARGHHREREGGPGEHGPEYTNRPAGGEHHSIMYFFHLGIVFFLIFLFCTKLKFNRNSTCFNFCPNQRLPCDICHTFLKTSLKILSKIQWLYLTIIVYLTIQYLISGKSISDPAVLSFFFVLGKVSSRGK